MERSQQQRLDGLELLHCKTTLPLLELRVYPWNRIYQRRRLWAKDEYDVFGLYDNQRQGLPAKPEFSGRASSGFGSNREATGKFSPLESLRADGSVLPVSDGAMLNSAIGIREKRGQA